MYSAGRAGVQFCVDCGVAPWAYALAALRDPLGTLAWRLIRLGRVLRSTAPVLVAAAGEALGLLFEGRLFLGLVVARIAKGRGRHPQRGGQLGQGQLGGSKMTAAFLDVVDGHGR